MAWRDLLDGARSELHDKGEAWRVVEEASGWGRAELVAHFAESPPARTVSHALSMVGRRARGEPLQYVLGRWGFRRLELLVDDRVLIPRPETEVVAGVVVEELGRIVPPEPRRVLPPLVVDVGTGSGAIALSVADEVPRAMVWGTDLSADALAVARANLAGCGSRVGPRVRLLQGSWLAPLPAQLRGRVDLVVSNPPYVAEGEWLPPEVALWEPFGALVAGPTGLEGIESVVVEAVTWLARPGAVVVELAPHQGDAGLEIARRAGFGDVNLLDDLSGRPRVLVARVAA